MGANGPAATNGTRIVTARSIDVVPPDAAGNLVPATLQFHLSSGTAGHSQTEVPGQNDAPPALSLSNHVLTGGGHLSLATNDDALALPLTNSMSVYSLRIGQTVLQPEGHYAVTDQGDTVSLTLVGASRPSEVQGRQTDLATALASVAMSGGEMLSLRTTRHANGLLTVHVPEPGAHLSADTITAYALVIARKRLGVSVQAVRSVVVRYDTRTAGIEAVRVSSAGSH
ncbi:hypothetical protein DBV14_28755 [Variovorax sp. KBW07]|nr:hypothetical protein DBV14_28755 [Variovorax sp. KBW07]